MMTDPAVKIALALCVLLAGVCGATLFRRQAARQTPAQAAAEPLSIPYGVGKGEDAEKGTGPICRDQPSVGARPEGASHKLDLSPFPRRRLWLFSKHAARPYTDAAFAPGDGLVFGSESQGLPASLVELHADRCLRIPMRAEARSLNLAVSVAVAAYEALRQCASL
jgi:hypothetical protein